MIEHIGSTAVVGLIAKPIIDIGILLRCDAHEEPLRHALSELGFIGRGEQGTEGRYLFVRECEPDVRTHHVHVIKFGDDDWDRYLRFRDTLRRDAEIKTQYAGLKRALANRYSSDRAAYARAKSEFITRILALEAH